MAYKNVIKLQEKQLEVDIIKHILDIKEVMIFLSISNFSS